MKFAYYARQKGHSDNTEQHIADALKKLGHEVEFVTLGETAVGDVILFHKDIPKGDGLKVCWYFDKVDFNDREPYIKKVLKVADYLFLTDETWALANPNPKIRILRQGAGLTHPGKLLVTSAKIAFTGSLYGSRFSWVESLARKYGEDFQVFRGSFNEDFNNLCASVPIFISPREPSDDHYWSSRVYITWGAGGFLIHPRLQGLVEEYPYGVYYDTQEELYDKIDYYLKNEDERKKITKLNYDLTVEKYTYFHRVEALCNELFTTK